MLTYMYYKLDAIYRLFAKGQEQCYTILFFYTRLSLSYQLVSQSLITSVEV